jgi:hypothetical protein
LPEGDGTVTSAISPSSNATRSASINALMTNADPVWHWHFVQWQQCTINGSDIMRYRTKPHAQPPS